MEKQETENKYLISVLKKEGEWDANCIKVLKEMGFSQELRITDEPIPTPKNVFVKYENGKNPSAIKDAVLAKIETVIPKEEKERVYVVVTDDLVPLVIEELGDTDA